MAELTFAPVDPKKATKEQIEAGLALLSKKLEYEAKVKAGVLKAPKKWKDLSPAEKEKARAQGRKYAIRLKAISNLKDAKLGKAGIRITETEVQAEMARLAKLASGK